MKTMYSASECNFIEKFISFSNRYTACLPHVHLNSMTRYLLLVLMVKLKSKCRAIILPTSWIYGLVASFKEDTKNGSTIKKSQIKQGLKQSISSLPAFIWQLPLWTNRGWKSGFRCLFFWCFHFIHRVSVLLLLLLPSASKVEKG